MTNSPVVELLLPVLAGSVEVRLEAVALAAEVITADARANIWLIDLGKNSLSADDAIRFVEESGNFLGDLQRSVERFRVDKDHAKFEQALIVVRDGFRAQIERS